MLKRLLSTLFAASLLSGCATAPDGTTDYAPAIRTAVAIGTSIAVQEHPEWRPQFETVMHKLRTVEEQEQIDFGIVLQLVQTLPVKELRSDSARIAFTSASILLSGYGGPKVDVTRIKPVVTALREGFELGLSASVTPTRTRGSKAGYTAK